MFNFKRISAVLSLSMLAVSAPSLAIFDDTYVDVLNGTGVTIQLKEIAFQNNNESTWWDTGDITNEYDASDVHDTSNWGSVFTRDPGTRLTRLTPTVTERSHDSDYLAIFYYNTASLDFRVRIQWICEGYAKAGTQSAPEVFEATSPLVDNLIDKVLIGITGCADGAVKWQDSEYVSNLIYEDLLTEDFYALIDQMNGYHEDIWTDWTSNDNDRSNGDYEPVTCAAPVDIQCRTVEKFDFRDTEFSEDSYSSSARGHHSFMGGYELDGLEHNHDHITCDVANGLVCKNTDQSDGNCENWEARYYCEPDFDIQLQTINSWSLNGGQNLKEGTNVTAHIFDGANTGRVEYIVTSGQMQGYRYTARLADAINAQNPFISGGTSGLFVLAGEWQSNGTLAVIGSHHRNKIYGFNFESTATVEIQEPVNMLTIRGPHLNAGDTVAVKAFGPSGAWDYEYIVPNSHYGKNWRWTAQLAQVINADAANGSPLRGGEYTSAGTVNTIGSSYRNKVWVGTNNPSQWIVELRINGIRQ